MLFERGPLDPVDVEAATVLGPRTTFAADAAQLAQQLGNGGDALGSSASVMASAWTSRVETEAGGDLAAAADAHDRQVRDFDSSIGAVAGNADSHVGEIAGFANDTNSDIEAGEPGFPDYEVHPPEPSWPGGEENPPPGPNPTPPPGGTVADLIIRYYAKYLRREPSLAEINVWSERWPNQDAIEHGILYSNENGDKVNALYQHYLDRSVTGDELAEHRGRKDSLDDVEDNVRGRA